MVKKIVLTVALIGSFFVANQAQARLQVSGDPTYTVSCSFDDGLGWSIETTDSHYATYYMGVCDGQGGDSQGGIH